MKPTITYFLETNEGVPCRYYLNAKTKKGAKIESEKVLIKIEKISKKQIKKSDFCIGFYRNVDGYCESINLESKKLNDFLYEKF